MPGHPGDDNIQMTSTISKIHQLLTPAECKSALVLLGFMVIGMVLETLGIGLVIPAIALLMQDDLAARYPAVKPVLERLGNPSPQALIVGAMLGLAGIYLAKNLFLAFLAWRQTRFAFGVQAQISQRLFTTYLRQPYTFHLQRNSAQLIRNTVTEVNQFTFNAITPAMILLTEGLVLLGIATLLLVVEPLGALIVVLVLGGAAWGFHHSTRARIARWGQARQHHDGLRIQSLQQGLGGAKDVKLLGRESDFLAQYACTNPKRTGGTGRCNNPTPVELPPWRAWPPLTMPPGRDMASIVPICRCGLRSCLVNGCGACSPCATVGR